MDITNGAWLLPTRGRADTFLPKFLAACLFTGVTTKGVLLVDEDNYDAHSETYDKIVMPLVWRLDWALVLVPDALPTNQKLEWGRGLFDSEEIESFKWLGNVYGSQALDWIGLLVDDFSPETPGWDKLLVEQLNGMNVVSSGDPAQPDRLAGAVAFSTDLIDAVGYMTPPGTQRLFFDDMWESLAKFAPIWTKADGIVIRHMQREHGPASDATAKRTYSSWAHDEPVFDEWRKTELVPAADRILKMLEGKGVKMNRPDFSDVSLMIATPVGDGKYERLFVSSLINTLNALRQFSATVTTSELPYMADLVLARCMLFGRFLRSKATHMLWIDSDMGWEPADVIKLLSIKRDFIAAAGPRKVFPPSFAVDMSDDTGKPKGGTEFDEETGFPIGSNIGMAFVLLTRECAERMAAAYRDELSFTTTEGREEIGVFFPMIVNKRYRGEDFAFCQRWRNIGGKIVVAWDISLAHVGSHTWRGDWLSWLLKQGETLERPKDDDKSSSLMAAE